MKVLTPDLLLLLHEVSREGHSCVEASTSSPSLEPGDAF